MGCCKKYTNHKQGNTSESFPSDEYLSFWGETSAADIHFLCLEDEQEELEEHVKTGIKGVALAGTLFWTIVNHSTHI